MGGRVRGGEGDAAARRGQKCNIIGHNDFAVKRNVEIDLVGAEGCVQNVHFEVRAGSFEENVVVANRGGAFVLGEGSCEAICWDG